MKTVQNHKRFPGENIPSILDLIVASATKRSGAVAISAPKRSSLSYEHLLAQIEYVFQELRTAGIGRKDRAALVLPDGPEMAVQLHDQGRKVALLALMDAYAPGFPEPLSSTGIVKDHFYAFLDRFRRFSSFLSYFSFLKPNQRIPYLTSLVKNQLKGIAQVFHQSESVPQSNLRLQDRRIDQIREYRPNIFPGKTVLFRPSREPLGFQRDPQFGWQPLISGGLKIEDIPGYHRTLIFKPRIRFLAEKLKQHLIESQIST